jgi:hypothetical protein
VRVCLATQNLGILKKGEMGNWGERYMVLESGCGIWEGIVG